MKLNFSDNLKALRKKHGYSREQLAEKLSYSIKSIEKWELSGTVPPVTIVCQLAELFGVTVDSLLFGNGVPIRYLLGIDGGGTKTEFLLTDREGQEVRRLILGASNPVDLGLDECRRILDEGIRRICEGISLREVSVFAGLAGGITGNHREAIDEFLSAYCFGRHANGSDVENACEMTVGDCDGMAVIMGTGIVAYAKHGGVLHRIAGWGYHVDKGGSGYNFGSDVLDCALKWVDGRGGSAYIKELVDAQLGRPIERNIAEIYHKGKSFVASFAPVVFDAYAQGDACAKEIIERNMKEVAAMLVAGLRNVEKKEAIICGGLCRDASILRHFLERELPDGYRIEFTDQAMVAGAVALAKKNIKENM